MLTATPARVAVVPDARPPYQAAMAMAGSIRMKGFRPWRMGSRGIRISTAAATVASPTTRRESRPVAGEDHERSTWRGITDELGSYILPDCGARGWSLTERAVLRPWLPAFQSRSSAVLALEVTPCPKRWNGLPLVRLPPHAMGHFSRRC